MQDAPAQRIKLAQLKRICREIVEAHGGRLSLANRPGGGALVTV